MLKSLVEPDGQRSHAIFKTYWTPMIDKYPATGFLKNLIAYETADNYEMNNPTIAHEGIRQEAVNYVDWILKNTGLDKKIEEVNAKAKEEGIE
ncbi:hypothetical protein [Paenibacillus methanolicus]|uniref:hypothetical protein n=1 Tax=Paenibacillus methanolicus TaxID=582686 RepID=UPI0011E6871F|nr:hypothetical protein [Paenibacillus methanolicus]